MLNWKRHLLNRFTPNCSVTDCNSARKKREHTSCSPIPSTASLLFARTGLHAVAGFAEFQGNLLAPEAGSCQGRAAVAVSPGDCGVVRRSGAQIHHVRWGLGNYVLALQNAYFHVGAAAVPLDLVVARLQLGSVDGYGM